MVSFEPCIAEMMALSPLAPKVTDCKNVAELLVQYLLQAGVTHFYGIPGGAIEPFLDALAAPLRDGRAHLVVTRHESGAANMADGYYRETGNMAVCFTTTGPGATNTVTGVATAFVDHIPMIVITPQVPMSRFAKGSFQDSSEGGIDTNALLKTCTRHSQMVTHAEQLPNAFARAYQQAMQRPRGPVHLTVPADVFRAPLSDKIPRQLQTLTNRHTERHPYSSQEVEALSDLLASSKRPVFFIGSRIRRSTDPWLLLAEKLNISVITTPAAKGQVPHSHPTFRGVFGFSGHIEASETLLDSEVDLVVAIGTNFNEWGTSTWNSGLMNHARLVHVDTCEDYQSRSHQASLHVFGHLTTIASVLIEELIAKSDTQPKANPNLEVKLKQNASSASAVNETFLPLQANEVLESLRPQDVMSSLSRLLPPSTRVLVDTGNSFAWSTHFYASQAVNRYHVSMGFGAMGWAIGAAVGTALASPNAPVVCITGDGSFLMSGQELSVAVAHRLSVVFIVMNNSSLGMVRHGQKMTGAESLAHELPATDFSLMARGQGASARVIHTLEELQNFDFRAVFAGNRPALLDLRIDGDEVPPIGTRISSLTASS